MPVLLDFESRSRADLKARGGRLYWEHPSSEALCVCWHDTRTGARGLWLPGEPWPFAGRVLAAHNADGFDRFAAERYRFGAAGWIDTSALARRAGLPGALDALGVQWLGVPKDDAGSRFTRALSSVRRPRALTAAEWRDLPDDLRREFGALPPFGAAELERVVAYCESDVAIMADAWDRLEAWRGVDERALELDRAVNERGIAFDVELARALLAADERNADAAVGAAAAELGWPRERVRAAAQSPAQCAAELGTADARKATLRGIDHPLVTARQALASIARGKLLAGLQRTSADGRLRDSQRYYGAHTGRWSGRGMQLQNLPRPAKRFEEWGDSELCRAADDAIAGHPTDAETVAVLLRGTLTAAPGHALVTCDFSGVEARALAWCAGDRDALAVFGSGRDPYKVAASAIFGVSYDSVDGVQRTVGKIAELALGYGMGAAKFETTARVMGGVELAAVGLRAADVVAAWRRAHAPTVRFWHAVDRAWRAAAEGRQGSVDRFLFLPGGRDELAVVLPSGRPVVYQEPRAGARGLYYRGPGDDPKALRAVCPVHWAELERVQPGPEGACPDCCAVVPGVWRTHIYGGKIAENLIQALCRDLLADALDRAEVAGLRPVLTVHDEIVGEIPCAAARDGYAALQAIMRCPPGWARGFPADAKGWHGKRYRK